MSLWTVKAADFRRAQAEQLAEILRSIDPDDPVLEERRYASTLAGDSRKLRGVPVQAKGVGGTQPGSDPLLALLAKERRAERAA